MGWDVSLFCIKGNVEEIKDYVLDVLFESEKSLHLEDAISITMGSSLAVSTYEDWVIIFDTQNRFINNESFPLNISRKYKAKCFYISEDLIYRDYNFSFFKKGGKRREYIGIKQGEKYLLKHGISKIDDWGESIILQIIEKEIFGNNSENLNSSLFNLKYSKYDL